MDTGTANLVGAYNEMIFRKNVALTMEQLEVVPPTGVLRQMMNLEKERAIPLITLSLTSNKNQMQSSLALSGA